MNNRSGGKKIITILLIVLLIFGIIGGVAYLYLATDFLKTPEQLFKKYMLSNVVELSQFEISPFDDMEKRAETELAEYSLKLGVDAKALEIEDTDTLDMNFALKTDNSNKNKELEILINKDENEYFKGYMTLSNETFGISIPDLYDKYIAVENRDFKKMAKTFELSEEYIEMLPDKIPSGLTPEEEEKITALANTYLTKMLEQLDENSYIAENDIGIKVDSKDVIADKYTLQIGTQKLYTIFTSTLTELLNDQEFINLITTRIDTKQFEELKNNYQTFLKENPVENIEDENISLSVYAADGKTVKTELKTNEVESCFSIINSDLESKIISYTTTPKDEYNVIGSTTTTTIKNTYTNENGELIIDTLTSYNKDDIEALQAEYDAEYADYGSDFEKDYSEIYADESIRYVINTKKSNEDTITGTITFDNNELEKLKENIDISFKCQFGKASITTLSNNNSIIINDYTMDDYQNLLTELSTNLVSLSLRKPDSLIPSIFTSIMMDNSNSSEDSSSLEDDFSTDDTFYSDDYSSEDSYTDYDNINFSDESSNDNYMYPTVTNNTEMLREEIDTTITSALEICLTNYKDEITYNNPEANLGEFLNIDKVQEYSGTDYALELLDGTTIKCTTNRDGMDYIYYALMNIDETYTVREVEVLTEEEFSNR